MTAILGRDRVVSASISPYAYDYDLPIAAIGVALLLPDLIKVGRKPRAFSYDLPHALYNGLRISSGL